jgi:mono/diheme cytochrome c family protein
MPGTLVVLAAPSSARSPPAVSMPPRLAPAVLILLLLTIPARADDGRELFPRVRAILTDSCMSCHDPATKKGGLDLSRRDPALAGGESGEAIVPGRPEASLVIEKVVSGEMPPKGDKLTVEQIDALKKWVAAGAGYDGEPLAARRAGLDWWALRPIARSPVPAVKDAARVRNPIDAFVLAKLEAAHLNRAPEADRRTLIRRLTFDLTGLPPSPREIDDFLNDARPDAYERVVDRLLASPRYGERWARHWLDAVRFGESHGYETNNLRPSAWPYRDWAIRAFNDDLPFARFVAEQIAGDALPDGDWLSRSATGFLVGGTHDVVGNQTPEGMKQQRVDDLDDMITATGSAFLGLTVHCARCHDHKFDPIKQADYYGLQAIFAGVEHAERAVPAPDVEARRRDRRAIEAELTTLDAGRDAGEPLTGPGVKVVRRRSVEPERNVERFLPTRAKFVRFSVRATADGAEPCIDELEVISTGTMPKNLALASLGAKASASSLYPNDSHHAIEHVNDGLYGNSWSWISREPGGGWIEVELADEAEIDRVTWGRDRLREYRDRLPTSYRVEVATEPGKWHVVADSTDRSDRKSNTSGDGSTSQPRRDELRAKLAGLADTMPVYAGTFKTPEPTHILRRGDPMQPGVEVPASGLSAVRAKLEIAPGAPESGRRLALARWIADPANPLPARVAVNRAWHHHFGRGIVATPGDFGFNGDRPSHAELLDWLAREFLENGGRLKPIHRLIVTSATYRQSSRIDPGAMAQDRDNRLLWRMTPRRLEAEAIRDAMLAASGSLDLRMGGPGYSIWEENTNYVVVFKHKNDLGPEANRRMIYQFKPRSQPDPTFGAFDCPDSALVAPRRNTSTTALQALNLLNSRFVMAQSKALAARLQRDASDDPSKQVSLAFRLTFGRDPTPAEADAGVKVVREHGAATLARALYNANEFVYVR